MSPPVKGLRRPVGSFTALGFAFDPRFTDENATCMSVSEESFVMLLAEDLFTKFMKKRICGVSTHTEAILALSARSREEVDERVDRVVAAGGRKTEEPFEEEGVYSRSFQDVDGHLWEVAPMGVAAVA